MFVELGDYKDAAKEAARFHYAPTNTTIKSYIEGKEEVMSYTTIYNDENLPLQTVTKYVSGLVHTCNYTYSDQGQILIIDCIESTGNTEYTEYTYDENGNYKTSKHSTSLGSKYDIEYFYDENNRCIKETRVVPPIMNIEYTMIYDEAGNLIKKFEKSDSGAEHHYEYSYKFVYVPYDMDSKAWEELIKNKLYI